MQDEQTLAGRALQQLERLRVSKEPPVVTLAELLVESAAAERTISLVHFAATALAFRSVVRADEGLNARALALLGRLSASKSTHNPVVSQAVGRLISATSCEKEIARDLRIHPSTLGRALRASVGMDFRELRRAVLIRPAIPDVVQRRGLIRFVAVSAGYCSYSRQGQFTRDFVSVVGLTPTQLQDLLSHGHAHS